MYGMYAIFYIVTIILYKALFYFENILQKTTQFSPTIKNYLGYNQDFACHWQHFTYKKYFLLYLYSSFHV